MANVLVSVVAILHVYFMFLEMFLWTKPKGLKIFGNTLEKAKASELLASNQGLYNGFLAAGLTWGLLHPSLDFSFQIKLFFLSCVILAGLYGTYSVTRKIFYFQALPAVVAMILLMV